MSTSTTPMQIIHSIYYYTIVFFAVAALSIASISLTRQILVDTIFPELNEYETYYYNQSYSCKIAPQDIYLDDGQYLDDEQRKMEIEKQRKQDEESCLKQQEIDKEMAVKRANLDKKNTYISSILTIFVASVILATHYFFVRPNKSKNASEEKKSESKK